MICIGSGESGSGAGRSRLRELGMARKHRRQLPFVGNERLGLIIL
jgi:hypothetical protein